MKQRTIKIPGGHVTTDVPEVIEELEKKYDIIKSKEEIVAEIYANT